MRYAVNLCDLTGPAQDSPFNPILILLQPVLTQQTVECEPGRFDGDSLLVKEDCSEERWQAIVSILRDIKRIPKAKLRMYESKTGRGGWTRI